MLYENTIDISSSRGAAIRYLIAAATKNTMQTTVQTLEKMAAHSVELHRFIIMAVVSATWRTQHNEDKCALASKLVIAALEKNNALTLVSAAVDESPTVVTKESLTGLMTKDLKLSHAQQLHFAMGLLIDSAKGKEAAAAFLNSFNVSQNMLKDENSNMWAFAILARQAGDVKNLDMQLSAAYNGITPIPHNDVVDTHVNLSKIIGELGTACVATQADCRELLSFFPHPFTENDVADVLGFFASQGSAPLDVNTYNTLMSLTGREPTKTQHSATISPIPLLELLQERCEGKVDWDAILRLLDKHGEEAFKQKHVAIVFDAYHKFKGTGSPGAYPPINIFLGRWNNIGRQRSAFEYILRHPEKVSLQSLPRDQMAPAELLDNTVAATPATASMTSVSGITRLAESEFWRFFPVVETAVHIASRDCIFDSETLCPAIKKQPLLFFYMFLFGAFVGTVKNFILAKLILKERWLSLDQVVTVILPEAEKRGRLEALIMLLSELTIVDESRTVDVMEAVLKSKSATKAFLASGGNPRLVTAIAMCMEESVEPSGDTWISKALEGKLHFRASTAENRFSVAMAIVEVAEQLLDKQKYVSNATAALNKFLSSSLKDVLRDVAEKARVLLASSDSLFPSDIENEAMQFYKHMYSIADPTNSASLDFIEQLLKSPNSRDKQLYACIVSIMFEESSAIGCYPTKELRLFAVLYGQMIARELLPHNQQQRAWNLLLPVILKPTDFVVEEYGIIALEQIKPKLAEWPHCGRALRHVKDLDIKIPGIMAAINRGIKAEEAARQMNTRLATTEKTQPKEAESLLADPAVLAVSTEKRDAAAAAERQKERATAATLHQHDIGTLLSSSNITAPPRVIREQINFLIGNTDMHNIDNNATELTKQLRPEYYEYFAEYLVVKRAALEPNYHDIYLELLDKLQSKQLEKAIRSATVSSIRRLLKSDKIRSDPGERTLLKNLGSWLGLLTLAKNIPITMQELSFKDLLFTGLREGKLMAVVSCITRVLHYCKASHFFCPPNPWTMRLLCLLWEMYNLKHLRITLRFEVEVLCNHIGVSLKDIDGYGASHPLSSSTQVRMIDVYNEINIFQSEDFRVNEKELQESSTLVSQQLKQQLPQSQQQQQMQQSQQPQQQQQQQQQQQRQTRQLQVTAEPFKPKESVPQASPMVPFDSSAMRRPPIRITIDSVRVSEEDASCFAVVLPAYKAALVQVLEHITREAKATVQRAATIAMVTAFNIVTKDFLLDPDVRAMWRAGDAMARSLAANLCTVTIRDALLELFNKHVSVLADRFLDLSLPNAMERRNRLCTGVVEKNIDLCIHVLEYQAAEEAARKLQEKMLPTMKEKVEAMASREPPRFPKEQYQVQDFIMQMGEVLRPSRSLPPLQRAVYEDFKYSFPIVEFLAMRLRAIDDATTFHYSTENSKILSLASPEFANGQFGEGHNIIRSGVVGISNMITRETAIYCVGYVLHRLMELAELIKQIESATERRIEVNVIRQKNICTLRNEVYIFVLQTCFERGGDPVCEELTRLFLQDDQRWQYTDLAVDLLRIKVLSVSKLDEVISMELQGGTVATQVVEFAGQLIRKVVIAESFISSRDLKNTLSQLELITRQQQLLAAHQHKHSQQHPHPHHQQQHQQQQQQHQRHSEATATSTTSGGHGASVVEAYPPLSSLVGADIKRFVVFSQMQHDPEDVEKVRCLFDEWIDIDVRRTQGTLTETTSTSGTAATTTSSSSSSSAPGGTSSSSGNPPQYDFLLKVRGQGRLETNCLGAFLSLCIRFAVEHYATRSLELERANPAAVKDALTADWKPGNAPPHRYPYDGGLFTKVDAFSDLATVVVYYFSYKNDSRHLLSMIRRVMDAFQRSLIDHHQSVVAQLQQHGPTNGELPANTAYLPMFQQQPYVRFFSNLFTTFVRSDMPNRDTTEYITHIFAEVLLRLAPIKYPAFAFGWLELVSHRIFFNRCLRSLALWPFYASLLVQGIEFIEFFTRDGTIPKNVLVFYKAFFKLMLVLTHDYSRFLIAYHYQLCDAIPPYCAQLLNTVLCSFPSGLKLPEFFLRVPEDSPEMRKPLVTDNQVKCIEDTFRHNDFDGGKLAEKIRDERVIDEAYMQSVVEKLHSLSHWRLMNAIVLHVCLAYLEANEFLKPDFSESNAMRFYRYLASTLDQKHRYHFICSCANHLRYPNLQTSFFVKVVLLLFLPHSSISNATTQLCIQEQITRVAVEKTLIIQPHPWGVLSTFMELMRAPEYGFWEKKFITGTSFLESMFHKLRRSVESRNAQQQQQQQEKQQEKQQQQQQQQQTTSAKK